MIIAIENQKFVWHRQHAAVKGKATRLLTMQTYDFAFKFFFSNISLIMPPINEDINPHIASEAAFATAY